MAETIDAENRAAWSGRLAQESSRTISCAHSRAGERYLGEQNGLVRKLIADRMAIAPERNGYANVNRRRHPTYLSFGFFSSAIVQPEARST
jgi:hypothetical protein